MKSKLSQKLLAGILSVAMLLNMGITPVFAATGGALPIGTSSVCTHHVHDEKCGYTEGTPCTHEHTDECSTEITKCVHEHTAECSPVQDSGEATGSDAKEPTACTHQCSAESGCITKELACKHVHDDKCGYTEGKPCTFDTATCESCNPKDSNVNQSQNIVADLMKKIDALPKADEITDENRDAATADFEVVWKVYEALSEDETITDLDGQLGAERMAKLIALREVLFDMVTLAGEVYAVYDGSKFWRATQAEPSTATSEEILSTNKKSINHLYIMGSSAPQRLMQNCTKLKTVICADTVNSIDQYAFSACTGLASVEMPSVTTIATYGFKQCPIKSIEMPNVTSINKYAFFGCGSLTIVAMPKVTSIGDTAFKSCTNLTSVEMPKVETIDFDAFYGCTGLTSANMPKVTSIGNQVFNGCTNLASLTLGATPPTVGTDVFTNCPTTRTLIIQGNTAFQDAATALTAYKTAADDNTTDELWWGWTLPTAMVVTPSAGTLAVTTGNSTSNLGQDNAITLTATFDKAAKSGKQRALAINEVEFKDGANTLGNVNATKNDQGKWVATLNVVTKNWAVGAHNLTATFAGNEELVGSTTNEVTVTVNEVYAVYNGSTFYAATAEAPSTATAVEITDKKTINNLYIMGASVQYSLMSSCTNLKTVTCADTVTSIGEGAFAGCKSLTSVAMPTVTTIGDRAFSTCANLASVELPSATTIIQHAFKSCTSLTSAKLPSATTIGNEAFSDCSALASVEMPKVTSIGESAFWGCTNLASLTLGATPPTVGTDPFYGCPDSRTLTIQGNPAFKDTVLAAYKAVDDGVTDELWWDWTLPTALDGTGVSNSAGTLAVTTG
ncbi:MAG: leucine-rich repeat protein, partial [Clostridia bacterium]